MRVQISAAFCGAIGALPGNHWLRRLQEMESDISVEFMKFSLCLVLVGLGSFIGTSYFVR